MCYTIYIFFEGIEFYLFVERHQCRVVQRDELLIDFKSIPIQKADDYDIAFQYLKERKLTNRFTRDYFKILKILYSPNRCDSVILEYPYFDSEYLSSYYSFYVKKFKTHEKRACRIHFFNKRSYKGYIVFRPEIGYSNLSKSYLDPSLFVNEKTYIMLSPFKVHIYGDTFYVAAFPWMNQQRDFSTCAHVAVWSIMKYYGNEHTGFRDTNIGEIVEHLSEQADRKLPSKGLNLQQIAEIFKYFGMTPVIAKKESGNERGFFREICSYIESGIPLIAAINSKAHIVSVIGHGRLHPIDYELYEGLIDHTDFIDTIVVNDDNRFPYHFVRTHKDTSDNSGDYTVDDIDFIVVPLYNRIHLEYPIVYDKVKKYLSTRNLNISEKSVIRIYLTSANSIKEKAFHNKEMNAILKDIILTTEMPRFVWCADIASPDLYEKFKTEARIIIDSTASASEDKPWLIIHDREKIIQYSEGDWNETEVGLIKPYEMFTNNLKEIG